MYLFVLLADRVIAASLSIRMNWYFVHFRITDINRKDKKVSRPVVHNRFKFASVVLKIDGYDSVSSVNCGCTIVSNISVQHELFWLEPTSYTLIWGYLVCTLKLPEFIIWICSKKSIDPPTPDMCTGVHTSTRMHTCTYHLRNTSEPKWSAIIEASTYSSIDITLLWHLSCISLDHLHCFGANKCWEEFICWLFPLSYIYCHLFSSHKYEIYQ